jgi:hypothetical protein
MVSIVDPMQWAYGRGKPAQERVKKKPHFLPVTNLSLLQMLEKVWSDSEADMRIILSDIGIQVEVLQHAESFRVEPVVGDVTRIGIAITNSETGGPLPVAKGYSLRLTCKNGNTIRIHDDQRRGLGRFSSDWRCSLGRRFSRFTDDIRSLTQAMQVKCGVLQSAYRLMAETKLDDIQFYNWYRQAQYLFRMASGSEDIDRMFGVEPDDRQEYLRREGKRNRTNRAARTGAIQPPQSTDLLAWDVFNGITQAARDQMHYQRRTGLEGLAGDVVSAFLPSLN